MKYSLVGLLVLSAMSSQASYELLLVADPTERVIHRLDSVSGSYLGTFGKGILSNPRSVAVNASLGRAYVFDSTQQKVFTFSYSTGVMLSSFSTAPLTVSPSTYGYLSVMSSGNLLLGLSYGGGFQLTPGGSLTATYIPPASQPGLSKVIQGQDGRVYGVNWNQGQVACYNAGGGASIGVSATNTAYWDLVSMGAEGIGLAANAVVRIGMSPSLPSLASSTFTPFGLTGATALARGHGNAIYLGGATSTAARIARFDGTDFTSWGFIENPAIKSVAGMATVVAPEPLSVLTLVGGLAVLVRRRRK